MKKLLRRAKENLLRFGGIANLRITGDTPAQGAILPSMILPDKVEPLRWELHKPKSKKFYRTFLSHRKKKKSANKLSMQQCSNWALLSDQISTSWEKATKPY